ncbi:MAG: DnaA N-terminal domain-containing protein [Dehalococcoidia bacterium]|nr:DnaA N-terminal domain-containing protein [Dehalococcoidia bacterium]
MTSATSVLPATSEVKALEDLDMKGNIIPHGWYTGLLTAGGRPDLVAITVLSEIVYWYRPSRQGGRKFSSDLYQRSYESLASFFGFNVRQVKNAVRRLEDHGLVERAFRTIDVNGQKFCNVLFFQVFPNAIQSLCKGIPYHPNGTECTPGGDTGGTEPGESPHPEGTDIYGEGRGDSPDIKDVSLNETEDAMSGNGERIWTTCLGRLQLEMPRESYKTWLASTSCLSLDNGRLVINVPSTFTAEWLERRLKGRILEIAREVDGEEKTSRIDDIVFYVGEPRRSARAGGGELRTPLENAREVFQ